MDREQHNLMQNRVTQIRYAINRINKFGMSTQYYLTELEHIERQARQARIEVESIEYQSKLDIPVN